MATIEQTMPLSAKYRPPRGTLRNLRPIRPQGLPGFEAEKARRYPQPSPPFKSKKQ